MSIGIEDISRQVLAVSLDGTSSTDIKAVTAAVGSANVELTEGVWRITCTNSIMLKAGADNTVVAAGDATSVPFGSDGLQINDYIRVSADKPFVAYIRASASDAGLWLVKGVG